MPSRNLIQEWRIKFQSEHVVAVDPTWRPLNPEYVPGPFDVICARGHDALNHTGNRRLRHSISMNLDRYKKVKIKFEKTVIVWDVIDSVRSASPDGGFIKFANDRWYEVGDHIAREKVGQSFRDRLHSEYRSSSKAKLAKRKSLEKEVAKSDAGESDDNNPARRKSKAPAAQPQKSDPRGGFPRTQGQPAGETKQLPKITQLNYKKSASFSVALSPHLPRTRSSNSMPQMCTTTNSSRRSNHVHSDLPLTSRLLFDEPNLHIDFENSNLDYNDDIINTFGGDIFNASERLKPNNLFQAKEDTSTNRSQSNVGELSKIPVLDRSSETDDVNLDPLFQSTPALDWLEAMNRRFEGKFSKDDDKNGATQSRDPNSAGDGNADDDSSNDMVHGGLVFGV